MNRDRCTQEYVARHTAQGKSRRDQPLAKALRRQGGLPRADLLRRLLLAVKGIRRGHATRRSGATSLEERHFGVGEREKGPRLLYAPAPG